MVRSSARDIERIPIDSSAFESVGYDESRQTLAIEFKSRHVFHYTGVTVEQFEAFALSASKGRFYAQQIRGKVPSTPMTGKCGCGLIGYIGEECTECHGPVREIDRVHKD